MKSLAELIFPSRCLACSRLGLTICSDCRINWHPHIFQRNIESDGISIPILSAIQYSPTASKILLSAKESQIKSADLLLLESLASTIEIFKSRYGVGILVPVPSRRSANRRRGRNFLLELTIQLAPLADLEYLNILKHTRVIRDQSQLNLSERGQNLAHAIEVDVKALNHNRSGKLLRNIGPIILVDDLITTGATLAEAARSLHMAGFKVLGAVTSCTAKPLRLGGCV